MAKTFNKLTRPSMRKLASSEKLNEHGITFERQNNGDGVYTVNIMVDGQRIHRVIGRERMVLHVHRPKNLLRKSGRMQSIIACHFPKVAR
ncbi:hypothetical protein [Nitrosomonas ureae]|uniref:Uncharacterized protein n=1 Tax=Nitrosomonas ureae TaxID=44577 RepID=A0A2T5I598_9PROT|nr:hypothetical protein [Nitrosomonas ureae]PTQ79007.1 hypothetical protein C8R28_10598 [Nitrosomonas ureae]